MHRFWKRYTKAVVEAAAPRRMLEIGAEFGWNTERILEYCREKGAHLDVVDPVPLDALKNVLANFPEHHSLHVGKSVDVLDKVAPPDIAFVDGDHNWHTVYTELTMLYGRASEMGSPPPIIIAHDCAWPYARRDMYYNPTGLLAVQRHPYAYRAMYPGISELVDNGLNADFANALHEGGPQNGVLTAIEDFIASRSSTEIAFYRLPFFNGLGILVPAERMTPILKSVLDGFFSPEALLEACIALEDDGMKVRVELMAYRTKLTQRTEALERARKLLAAQAAEIEELKKKLSEVGAAV